MDANRTPCSIEAPVSSQGGSRVYFTVMWPGYGTIRSVRCRDFSPWLTAEALEAFDPDGREAGEFILEVAKAAAGNSERERRRHE